MLASHDLLKCTWLPKTVLQLTGAALHFGSMLTLETCLIECASKDDGRHSLLRAHSPRRVNDPRNVHAFVWAGTDNKAIIHVHDCTLATASLAN
jgi:hypothetical protein